MDRQEAIEIVNKHKGYWCNTELRQAIDTLIASITVTDEMVKRATQGVYKIGLGDEFAYVDIRIARRHAKAALTAALGGDDAKI